MLKNVAKCIFTCNIWFRYSRERARQKFANICKKLQTFANFACDRLARRFTAAQREAPREARAEQAARHLQPAKLANLANLAKICKFLQIFGGRACSRLYPNEILQENMRLTAFFKLHKICILFHLCNLNFLAKIRFEKSAIVVKFQQKSI